MMRAALLVLLALTAASTSLATAEPIPNPCAHRIFCGPVRLVPKDPGERRAFYLRIGLQIADGIVTSAGLRSNRATYPDLFRSSACMNSNTVCGQGLILSRYRGVGTQAAPAVEIDPFVQVFAHGGLASMLVGGLAFDVASARVSQHWTSSARTSFDLGVASAHVAGISSWLPILANRRATDAAHASCARAAADGFVAGKNDTKDGLALYLPASAPANCSEFSSLPLVRGF